jgi:hypothetical protein
MFSSAHPVSACLSSNAFSSRVLSSPSCFLRKRNKWSLVREDWRALTCVAPWRVNAVRGVISYRLGLRALLTFNLLRFLARSGANWLSLLSVDSSVTLPPFFFSDFKNVSRVSLCWFWYFYAWSLRIPLILFRELVRILTLISHHIVRAFIRSTSYPLSVVLWQCRQCVI